MSRRKLFLLITLFLCLLTSLRLVWMAIQATPDHPHASRGVLDLREWNFEGNRSITLNGEWEFYPEQLVPNNERGPTSSSEPAYIQVPSDWRTSMPGQTPYGYGTYRLRIMVSGNLEQPYGFWVQKISAASAMYVNGEKLSSFGPPAENKEHYKAKANTYSATYAADGRNEIELFVHAANFDNPRMGGIVKSIRFGSQAAIDSERMYSIGFQLVTIVILLLHALYAGIVFLFNRRQKVILSLIVLFVCAALSVATDDDLLLLLWLPISFAWSIKLKLLSYAALSYFMLRVIKQMFPEYTIGGKLLRWYDWFVVLYAVFLIIAPHEWILLCTPLFSFAVVFPVVAINFIIAKMLVRNYKDAFFLLMAAASVLSSIVWGSLKSRGYVDVTFYPFDIVAAVVGFSAFWFKQYFRNAEQNAKLTEWLQKEDRLKDEFLANTSHELRTPLHGIMNIAQSVANDEWDTMKEKNRKDLELLITISRRMSYTLNDLLDLSQLKENRVSLRPGNVRVQSVATGVIDMVRYLTEGKPIRIGMEIAPSFPAVIADEKRLVQILFNLLHNAIKFTHEGMISVSAEIMEGRAAIHVSDTGIGMDYDTQARAFLPYEQGAAGFGVGAGIGLGLSICRSLIELHGGLLTLRSAPGEGSVFTFTLPLSDNHHIASYSELPDPSAAQGDPVVIDAGTVPPLPDSFQVSKEAPSTGNPKILAVDDDSINLKVLSNILSSERYDITVTTSGVEAVSLLETTQWDLLIADVMMSRMSGYELARIVRERYSISELPILLLTARNQQEDVYSGFLSGANDYVTKPVDAMELKYRVRALISLKQSVGERLRMEAAYLQAQIQPHFLFNTLNSITALGDIDTNKMNGLVEAFSTYLRISFDFWNSERLVPLEHELTLVRSYLYIEKERFEDRLNVVWEIEPNHGLQLPPLTIQPVVENAVKHGILSKFEGGTVRITITNDNDYSTVTISDDGAGIDQEKISGLLNGERRSGRGIGLLNTHRRLTQQYGEGLFIHSEPGVGTTISFRIPKSRSRKSARHPKT
ncbi:response regulator [Paenibacillus hemerocallicola]|uniref:histidine kinase n=1 Tax=Paenibacillus hemerocallicola TaxID=1172614 RepID=A0A5C4TH28_9BACL|nr:ATP-binding protein [Paenibacillus hemerocallicola]TNJ67780.1 response regulator [Paenibacillus hemerocallicola]